MRNYEVNFDGLIGPTHNYGGLSHGNIASKNNALKISHPKKAALQGLEKMQYLRSLGLSQGVLLPQQRPHLPTLRALGFDGSDKKIIEKASNFAPELLASCYSASCMWTANACTVSPSSDSMDGKVHFTAANLSSMFHRSIEYDTTAKLLREVFDNEKYFCHHDGLPSTPHLGDEGAANHNRFSANYSGKGLQLFVFGRYAFRENKIATARFPSRQTFEASAAISRLHQLEQNRVVFAQQNPKIVDAGAFHNDVVSVGNLNTLFMHEEAFANKASLIAELELKYNELQISNAGTHSSSVDQHLHVIEVPTTQVPLELAVKSYLFNSQLITLPDSGGMALILPEESRANPKVLTYLESLQAMDTPIKHLKFVDVRQSMQNGGGPACLRLRVVLNDHELTAVNSKFLLDDELFATLKNWIERHYRDEIRPEDLSDPALAMESFAALEELTRIFGLGAFYDFQKAL